MPDKFRRANQTLRARRYARHLLPVVMLSGVETSLAIPIDAFEAVMMREERMLGYFVGFEFTGDALFEIDRFRRKEGREIKTLTVREILNEEISGVENAE